VEGSAVVEVSVGWNLDAKQLWHWLKLSKVAKKACFKKFCYLDTRLKDLKFH
jgi:hypothetical protein